MENKKQFPTKNFNKDCKQVENKRFWSPDWTSSTSEDCLSVLMCVLYTHPYNKSPLMKSVANMLLLVSLALALAFVFCLFFLTFYTFIFSYFVMTLSFPMPHQKFIFNNFKEYECHRQLYLCGWQKLRLAKNVLPSKYFLWKENINAI